MPLRVMVVEDHPLFRKGVVALLDAVPDFSVAGVAVSGEEAVQRAAETGGSLRVAAGLDGGTRVLARLPLTGGG